MKHVFEYLDHAEDREHAESVATKEIELTHLEKYTIRAMSDAANHCGRLEIVQPGGFDELMRFYFAEGDESFVCGAEARMVAIAALLRVMREPDLHHMVAEMVEKARDLESQVEDPDDF
ncbi:hypothetical protein FCX82_04515 [Escherichia coli]|nr:hypothetical protein [Escherichia coli]